MTVTAVSNFKGTGYIFRGGYSEIVFASPLKRGLLLKEKICSEEQILFFRFLFRKGLVCRKSKQEVTRIVSLIKDGRKSARVSSYLKDDLNLFISSWAKARQIQMQYHSITEILLTVT